MDPAIQSAWVQPATETGGLDHLGVRGPCIHIYGDLLPGINNVTDRLRYYSFYTWLIWSLDKRGQRANDEETRQLIRRADCLFTLIGNHHARRQGDGSNQHAAALVGNLTLGPALSNLGQLDSLNLSTYATEEPVPNRYFKNRFGGLGQYYLGSLRDVLLLAGDGSSGIRYTKERGRPLAEAFENSVDSTLFWKCVDQDRVTLDDLDGLATFCPCELRQGSDEQLLLTDILFGRDQFVIPAGMLRRDTLRVYLHLANSLAKSDLPTDVEHFRAAVYSGSLGNGQGWSLSKDLDKVRQRWSVYVTNEILSLGLQGVFYGVLATRFEQQNGQIVETAYDLAGWFLDSDIGAAVLQELEFKSFSGAIESTRKALPDLKSWRNVGHELALVSEVSDLGDKDASDEVLIEVVCKSVRALLALAARLGDDSDPYSHITFPKGYFDYYPLNLRSFMAAVGKNWRDLSFKAWLAQIIADWTVNAHIRVALRKLRGQSKATFQVRPTDESLVVIGTPTPEFSNPRFKQGRQVLIDLGAINIGDNDRCLVTEFGNSLLEHSDG
jgi:hypothetical protein